MLRFWMIKCIVNDVCNAGMPGGMPDMGGATSAGGAGSGAGPTIEEVD